MNVAATLDDALRIMIQEIVRAEVAAALAHTKVTGEYISTTTAARLAGVSQGTVRRWVREGRLVAHGAGREIRIKRDELEALMRVGRGDSPRGDGPDSPEARGLRALEETLAPRSRGAAKTPQRH